MHEELVDVYNEDMIKTGTAMKKEAHRLGLWHKSIHCWLFTQNDGENYVIFQKRAASKLLMPNYYDVSVAGHYEEGEQKEDGFREVEEEFGLKVPISAWHYLGIKYDVGLSPNVINKEFCEVFFADIAEDISSFTMSPREVEAIVKIRVSEGQALFSGEKSSIEAQGITWDERRKHSVPCILRISANEFIPRTDFYYAKIFMIADLYYKKYKYLYI